MSRLNFIKKAGQFYCDFIELDETTELKCRKIKYDFIEAIKYNYSGDMPKLEFMEKDLNFFKISKQFTYLSKDKYFNLNYLIRERRFRCIFNNKTSSRFISRRFFIPFFF